jgi:hypothetical protein
MIVKWRLCLCFCVLEVSDDLTCLMNCFQNVPCSVPSVRLRPANNFVQTTPDFYPVSGKKAHFKMVQNNS